MGFPAACWALSALLCVVVGLPDPLPIQQRGTLLRMFNQESRSSLGWTGGRACNWRGVVCNTNQSSVVGINLRLTGINGTLPPTLYNLADLVQLVLQGNGLSGTIPHLPAKLQTVNLASNFFSGTVPDLSSLTQLITVDLSYNSLSGALPDLSSLVNVTHISFSSNVLTGPIPELGGLTSLKELYLFSNHFSGTIPKLPPVEILYLFDNRLSGTLPGYLARAKALRRLYLDINQLSGTIPAFTNTVPHGNLTALTLANNPWACPLPTIAESVWEDAAETTCGSSSFPWMLLVLSILGCLYIVLLTYLAHRYCLKRVSHFERMTALDDDDTSTDISTLPGRTVPPPPRPNPPPTSSPPLPSQKEAGKDPTVSLFAPVSSTVFPMAVPQARRAPSPVAAFGTPVHPPHMAVSAPMRRDFS